jgi:acetyl esterase/lipase
MIHGGGHVMLSRKDIRPKQTQLLLDRGLLPVSVDYRLCPEVTLTEGPIRDVCTALQWARERLPTLPLQRSDIRPRGDKVVVVGWSTGGTLSMTLPFTAPQRGVQPPDAILAFYCPTDYESSFWREPNYPERTTALMAEENYDLLEGVQEQPITGYNIPAHKRAVGGWMAISDPRSRIVLHMNWKGQALPVLLEGLPCKGRVTSLEGSKTWLNQPQPSLDLVRSVSPYAQIVSGNYKVPTFLIHGTKDDLVPWQQTQQTKNALEQHGVRNGIAVVEDAVHLFDLYRDRDRRYWEAVLQGYEFIFSQIGMSP